MDLDVRWETVKYMEENRLTFPGVSGDLTLSARKIKTKQNKKISGIISN